MTTDACGNGSLVANAASGTDAQGAPPGERVGGATLPGHGRHVAR